MHLTPHQAKYIAHDLTLQHAGGGVDRLSQALFNASVDLNPHQIEAAVFALRSPLSKGVLLADEVGLGKTIEAGIVLCQYWAERKRQLLVICPASLRKQWAQELEEKFNLPSAVLDSKMWRDALRSGIAPLQQKAVVIVSYAFAARMKEALRGVSWHLVVIDEAHKLRNAYRDSNKIGQALRWATADCRKLLLTATPLQNSILELYGLSTLIDDTLFGDIDAFRSQYTGNGADLDGLRKRLAGFCKRTLRKDVTEYINYTQRKPHTQKFRATDDEHRLYEAVTAYLLRDNSYAIPKRQRHLIELVLRKLLASSSQAIAGTLAVMKARLIQLQTELQTELQSKTTTALNDEQAPWLQTLIDEEELETDLLDDILNSDDTSDHTSKSATESTPQSTHEPDHERHSQSAPAIDLQQLQQEIKELDRLHQWANGIGTDTKTRALLQALEVGFKSMAHMTTGGQAQRKALIFTESRRTQEYLKKVLEENGHAGQIVLFSGTNGGPEAAAIYDSWLARNQGTGRITGSRSIDLRTALIEHFRDHAAILIATEAAAEGVNLQFCSLVINYDLPWNPQRVEQRIGRCHRYGQKHDVVVINFFNERNHADQRVLELLTDKFSLFNGVFGASDEVLGSIESGLDFEKRILAIYQTCRSTAAIDAAFNALRAEMDANIQARMADTRRQLIENFDADVHDRLRLQLAGTTASLDRFSRRFWDLSHTLLHPIARFNAEHLHFDLIEPPTAGIAKGRYHLISRQAPQASQASPSAKQTDLASASASPNVNSSPDPSPDPNILQTTHSGYTYRLSHPLGEWVIRAAQSAATPLATLVFNPQAIPSRSAVVEALRGQAGVLTLQKITIHSFEAQEYLLFSALTQGAQAQKSKGNAAHAPLDQETCQKLMACPATLANHAPPLDAAAQALLQANAQRHAEATIAQSLNTNNQHFTEARDTLDRWADDQVLAAEQALKTTKEQIKTAQRDARIAPTLTEQQTIQARIAKLERQQRQQRQAIFEVEDSIHEQRDQLINQLTQRMAQRVETETLFTAAWRVV